MPESEEQPAAGMDTETVEEEAAPVCIPGEADGVALWGQCDRGTIRVSSEDPAAVTTAAVEDAYCLDQRHRENEPYNWWCHEFTNRDDTSTYYQKPEKYIGKLIYDLDVNGNGVIDVSQTNPRNDERDQTCTATVIPTAFRNAQGQTESGNGSVVITAAHCLANVTCVSTSSGSQRVLRRSTRIRFVPGFKNKSGIDPSPYGVWRQVRQPLVPSVYTSHTPSACSARTDYRDRHHFDWGFVMLEKKNGVKLVTRLGGRMGIGFSEELKPGATPLRAIGYPTEPADDRFPAFNGAEQWTCGAGVTRLYDPADQETYDARNEENRPPDLRAIGCEMTEGSSGGGWFVNWVPATGGRLRSVISHTVGDNGSFSPQDENLAGPYLGRLAFSYYDSIRRVPSEEGPPN
jgi:hypothetical protein